MLLADSWTDQTHTDPAFAALMAGEFLVITGEGEAYSAQEVNEWLDQTRPGRESWTASRSLDR